MKHLHLSDIAKEQIIEMAWDDQLPFEKIEAAFGLNELEVINIMCTHMQPKSFERWKNRVSGKVFKDPQISSNGIICCQQKQNCSFAC